jgi:tRNA threonylcarbamoyladenosine biosynthesis protein TsaE
MTLALYSNSLADTAAIAKAFAVVLRKGDAVSFGGELGSGKTTFIKDIAQAYGVDRNEVTSTSFVIAREYEGTMPFMHADVYRIANMVELPMEITEFYRSGKGVLLMEWAENIGLTAQFTVTLRQDAWEERVIEIVCADKERGLTLSQSLERYRLKV